MKHYKIYGPDGRIVEVPEQLSNDLLLARSIRKLIKLRSTGSAGHRRGGGPPGSRRARRQARHADRGSAVLPGQLAPGLLRLQVVEAPQVVLNGQGVDAGVAGPDGIVA